MKNIDKFYKKLGEKIRKIRKSKSFTQEELAWKTGVSPNFIGFIERGEKKPSIETLLKIGEALEVPVSKFFEDFEYKIKEEDVLIKKISSYLKEGTEKEKKVIYQIVKSIIKKKK
ncbi:MAG: helix-turn-helix domain-containing protein [Candidatus Omnitrophica bacterium]|nr:helix-turn-helix domain-containing protein [Candidatus Omnitrophota bacterium]MCM8807806.1 helix-turn-helix domain-containing protein [Candidatus Omnitrophota bacterium]